jgi:hypothetical protein
MLQSVFQRLPRRALMYAAEMSRFKDIQNLLDSPDSVKVYLRAMESIPQEVESIPPKRQMSQIQKTVASPIPF